MSDDTMVSTIEVGGKTYPLATMTHHDQHVTYYDRNGNVAPTGHEPMTLMVSVTSDGARELYFSTTNPTPCRISFFGKVVYVARAVAIGHGTNPTQTDLRIDAITAVRAPAAPTLDELTDPADLDWGTIRSTCATRDWRAAWGVVGTDHTGDATPGEVYLLAVARRASATAAALWQWRKAEMESGTIFIGTDAAQAWQRIKRIAAWESSARAQYDERGNRRGRLQAAVRERYNVDMAGGSYDLDMINNPFRAAAMQARLYGRDNAGDNTLSALRQLTRAAQAADTTVRPTNMWIDEATLDALRQQAAVIDDPVELDPELYGNGRGVVGVLNNPFLSAAAQRGEITGTLTLAAATRTIADVRAATRETSRQIDALTRALNPAPRGPQTRKRR